DKTPFAKLGGGVRRWRSAVVRGGRWHNVVPEDERAAYVADASLEAIASRPERFGELLAEETPEAARDAALAAIERARGALRERPASCVQRTRREAAFEVLYDTMERSFGVARPAVDAAYRTLEDYVFAELDYARSKTCCWN